MRRKTRQPNPDRITVARQVASNLFYFGTGHAPVSFCLPPHALLSAPAIEQGPLHNAVCEQFEVSRSRL
jgi:hypothetical protein